MTKTEDRNETDHKKTALGHLPKWILLQDWMLQSILTGPALWGIIAVACVSETNTPPAKRPKRATTKVPAEDTRTLRLTRVSVVPKD